MAVCECGCNKLENRTLNLCGSCNQARIRAERPEVVKEKKPLNPISDKRKAALKKRAEGYREVLKITERCLGCGTTRNLTPSHVLTQKKFPLHAANPANIVPLCGDKCHPLWENNKQLFRELCPKVWDLKMHIMQELEPAYYLQFISKHGA
jgi:hypothetical protein